MNKNKFIFISTLCLLFFAIFAFYYLTLNKSEVQSKPPKRLFAIYQQNTTARQWISLDELLLPYGINSASIETANEPIPIPTSAEYMIEVNEFVNSTPTPSQLTETTRIVKETRQAAIDNGWFSFKKATADGFNKSIDDVHYFNTQFMTDGNVLNPQRPEFLMFYDTPQGKLLVGAMFVTETQFAHGPQPGGSETIWHFHIQPNTCWEKQLPLTGFCEVCDKLLAQHNTEHSHHHNHEHSTNTQQFTVTPEIKAAFKEQVKCAQGTLYHRSPEMLHLWFIKHPQSQFATNMSIPTEVVMSDPFIIENADK